MPNKKLELDFVYTSRIMPSHFTTTRSAMSSAKFMVLLFLLNIATIFSVLKSCRAKNYSSIVLLKDPVENSYFSLKTYYLMLVNKII